MLYFHPDAIPEEGAEFTIHRPMVRTPEGHLAHGAAIAAADTLAEALAEARRNSNCGPEGFFVSDGWNVWFV
jgi:hypothetical protein